MYVGFWCPSAGLNRYQYDFKVDLAVSLTWRSLNREIRGLLKRFGIDIRPV